MRCMNVPDCRLTTGIDTGWEPSQLVSHTAIEMGNGRHSYPVFFPVQLQ